MQIEVYSDIYRTEWDNFISESKNGTFLFYRGFMEYHKDRYKDYSFLFYKKGELIAVLPGNLSGKTYFTHQGLTYGGLIMHQHIKSSDVLIIFDCLTTNLKLQGIENIVYKPVPFIYHTMPAEEDLYALFRHKAELIGRNISSSIFLGNSINYSQQRKRGIQKALKAGLYVKIDDNLQEFWQILSNNLTERYRTKPVHSLEEIQLLQKKFPQYIKLYTVYNLENILLGGVIVFNTHRVAHLQYIAATEEGKKNGALDLLVNHLLKNETKENTYFDFGTSTENNGLYLNEGLIHQKEGFGGRAIVYDIYSIKLK